MNRYLLWDDRGRSYTTLASDHEQAIRKIESWLGQHPHWESWSVVQPAELPKEVYRV